MINSGRNSATAGKLINHLTLADSEEMSLTRVEKTHERN